MLELIKYIVNRFAEKQDDIEYIVGWGTKNYESTLSITPKGKIEKKDGIR